MSKSDELYRAKADGCRRMADKAFSPLDKESWLKLAADWLKLLRPTSFTTEAAQFDAAERESGTGQEKSEREH
jgi:hypothetical protein